VSLIHKKTFYLQFCMGTPKATKKEYLTPQKRKKTKIHMGSIRQSLQAQQHKKVIKKPDQPIKIKKISNKSMFSMYFKSEKKAKIRMGGTQRSLQAQPKILKKLSVHQIYQSGRIFTNKVCLVP
jgi:hypothetical protein